MVSSGLCVNLTLTKVSEALSLHQPHLLTWN